MMNQDSVEEYERQKHFVDLGGFYSNPAVYFKMQEIERADEIREDPSRHFKVDIKTEPFAKKLAAVLAGKPIILEQNLEVAELVKRRREEIEATKSRDPRIIAPDGKGETAPLSESLDTIEVEYQQKP
jgi:hypothetical protein